METDFFPLFLADWMDVAFIHFRVDPQRLEPLVPFELDLFDGDAFISIVSFTQKRLRPAIGGRMAALLAAPMAEHEFLNLRTYVRHGDARGIYFIAEWIPNRLAQMIGPRLYGLPYRLGRLTYRHRHRHVRSREGTLELQITALAPHAREPLSEFLVERYTAFTELNGVSRRFDIAHAPWELFAADVVIGRSELMCDAVPCLADSVPTCSHYSRGVRDVGISAPRVITSPAARARRIPYRLVHSGNRGCP